MLSGRKYTTSQIDRQRGHTAVLRRLCAASPNGGPTRSIPATGWEPAPQWPSVPFSLCSIAAVNWSPPATQAYPQGGSSVITRKYDLRSYLPVIGACWGQRESELRNAARQVLPSGVDTGFACGLGPTNEARVQALERGLLPACDCARRVSHRYCGCGL